MADVSLLVQEIENLKRQLAEVSQRSMSGNRVLTAQGISDIDTRLGKMQSGQIVFDGYPSSPFTGLKIMHPAGSVDEELLAGVNANTNTFFINKYGNAISRQFFHKGRTDNPAYVDGYAIVYFYSSGGVDELRVRGKVGATETQVTLANITP